MLIIRILLKNMHFFVLFLGASQASMLLYLFVRACYLLGVAMRQNIRKYLIKHSYIQPQPAPIINTNSQNNALQPSVLQLENTTESDTSNDDYDSDEDIDISVRETVYEEQLKYNGGYYIGIPYYNEPQGIYLMNGNISRRSFLTFEYSRIVAYVRHISVFYVTRNTPLEILKLHIHYDGVYEVTVKTFWIRIIQRAWRKTFALRKHYIMMRGNVHSQEHFRITGIYPFGYRNLPSIHGLIIPLKANKQRSYVDG
jgi:hypothetical protein